MYVDYVLSHGGSLPKVINNQSMLAEFEKIMALESYADQQFGGAFQSEPVVTRPIFSSLSTQSLHTLDQMLLDGIPLPEELTNASLAEAFTARTVAQT